MCGILGYVGTGFSVSRFAGALRLLAHRGPFGEGIAALPNGAIGMTRLPMSGAAAVPLPPQEGQRRVAYNGEVYQAGCEIHGEIRLLLDGLQRGVLPDGMYALASWDPQTRQLTLLRDEFGIKPLYYSYQPERGLLAFASEPRALLHLLGGARADAEAIAQVVAAGVPLEGQTLFQQVRLLLPGEVLRFDLSQERPRLCQRQRLATAPASEVDSLDEQLGETLERCRQTFRPCALLEQFHPVNLATLAEDVLSELARQAIDKDIELSLHQETVHVMGIDLWLKAMVGNLVGNALRYTPAGGQVEIRVENRAQHAVLRVRDNGPGVALEEQQAIFTRFYRSPATSSGEGSGLGLPIVKRIVELHFGSIGLGKGLEGKGLEVQVFLPKTQPDATRPPARGPDSGRSHI